MLYRDAVVTTWLNVVAAPIAGTIEDFDLRPGRARRIVRGSRPDRQSQRRSKRRHSAEAAARQAAVRLTELSATKAGSRPPPRSGRNARPSMPIAFRRDLDLKIEEFAAASPCCGRGSISPTPRPSASGRCGGRQHLAGRRGSRDLHPSRAAVVPQRCHDRPAEAASPPGTGRAGRLPAGGRRSPMVVAQPGRAQARDAADRALGARDDGGGRHASSGPRERAQEPGCRDDATFKVPAGMTIWSTAESNGISVTRGQRLFTWIDCSRLSGRRAGDRYARRPRRPGQPCRGLAGRRGQGSSGRGRDEPRLVLAARQGGTREHRRMAEVGRAESSWNCRIRARSPAADRPPRLRALPDLTLMKFLRAYLPM